ncbi:MAG: PIN domain-containing protein [Gammaproteobacteria bacterium]|nr:PIN domain-containing protein [Gammaproteobacteria bacterium]
MSGVLVDTCVWSLALRSRAPKKAAVAEQLSQLIDDNQLRIIGPIRQELLSGYTDKNSFERLRQKLIYFPNESIFDADYESAAEYSNFCRSKGVQGSHTDFLICAVSIRAKFQIYTTDKDFQHYSKHLPISLL